MSWSAAQYSLFESERSRPVRDLLARIATPLVTEAADIGCGPGNSTELLQARYPSACIVGLDSSQNMIEAARTRLPQAIFEIGDIAAWRDPGPFDVLLSNAALQWVPDHVSLLPRLVSKLAQGGSLAVQMPDNLDEPAHRLMREIAADGPWADRLAPVIANRTSRHDADWYLRALHSTVTSLDIWRTTYFHVLAGGPDAVVEWFKGSGLRPFLDPLDDDERTLFLARYTAAIAEAYPAMPDGSVVLPFPRLFFVAVR